MVWCGVWGVCESAGVEERKWDLLLKTSDWGKRGPKREVPRDLLDEPQREKEINSQATSRPLIYLCFFSHTHTPPRRGPSHPPTRKKEKGIKHHIENTYYILPATSPRHAHLRKMPPSPPIMRALYSKVQTPLRKRRTQGGGKDVG